MSINLHKVEFYRTRRTIFLALRSRIYFVKRRFLRSNRYLPTTIFFESKKLIHSPKPCLSLTKPITRQNSPQYIASSDFEKELELQYRVHSALDVIEEKCAPGLKPTQDSRDLYLGLLYSTESHKMYFYFSFINCLHCRFN